MRFVETKTAEQQSCLMLHRTRHLFVRQQNAVINSIRAHLAELGIVAPVGRDGVEELLDVAADPDDDHVPDPARECVAALGAQLRMPVGPQGLPPCNAPPSAPTPRPGTQTTFLGCCRGRS
jgi:transposase